MKERTRQILTAAGLDLEPALERMMGNEGLLLRMLFKLDCRRELTGLQEAFASQDADRAFQACHSLKGILGNLSLAPHYALFSRLTELLRAGDLPAARAALPEAQAALESLDQALSEAKAAEEA